jgi:hypothetical protein
MAAPATGLRPCAIKINLFSGERIPLPAGTEVLVTLRDGNQNVVPLPGNGFFRASTVILEGLPFFDNFGDKYSVVVSGKGFSQTGFTPVTVAPRTPATVDLMLLPKDASFNFRDSRWDLLQQTHPEYFNLLAAGQADPIAAQNRFTQLMEDKPAVLACFFNLITAMSQIHLPDGSPLNYLKELVWDNTMQQDRFFAWADPAMVDQVAQAAAQGEFAPEVGTAIFHPGATKSWKQIQFGEANVQLTFHENDKKTVGGVDCIMVEPDIDYYKDAAAHTILEVATNAIRHSLTDPRQVYVLRWIAGRHAGVANFEPPYFVE